MRLSEEQAAYERKLLAVRPPQLSLEASSAQKSSSALIFRILASLQRRFQATGEVCAVGNARMDRQGFDNHNEVERSARVAPRQVPNNIEMDFAAYFKSSTKAADKVNTKLFCRKPIFLSQPKFPFSTCYTFCIDPVATYFHLRLDTSETVR